MKKHFHVRLLSGLFWFSGGVFLAGALAFTFLEEPRACAISVDKMNLLYKGVNNPMEILVRGVPESEVKVETDGIDLEKSGAGNVYYSARATGKDEGHIRISGGKLKPVEFKFRIKPYPDPVLFVGRRKGGEIDASEFKKQPGVIATYETPDHCSTCDVRSFEVKRVTQKGETVTLKNKGARFTQAVQALINLAASGDIFTFDEANIGCPIEPHNYLLGPMIFNIK
jgi:hypothetical protein